MPDGVPVNFPDDMPEAQIRDLIASKFPDISAPPANTGVGADVAKSVGSGLLQGASDLAMTVPNLVNQAAAGVQMVGRGAYPAIMSAGKSVGFIPQDVPERTQEQLNAEPMWQPFYGSQDVAKAAGFDYQPQTAAGKVAQPIAQVAGTLATAKKLQNTGKVPSAESVKAAAGESYQSAEALGGTLKPNITDKFLDDVSRLAPQTAEGKMLAKENAFTKISETLSQLRGRPLTLRAAQEIDEFLSDAADGFVDRTTGMISKEGKKVLDVQGAFRSAINAASESDVIGGKAGFDALKNARGLWSKAAKMRDIEKIVNRSEMMDNPATGLKTGFRTLANNSAKMRGYTSAEKKLINKAAKTSQVSDVLRSSGSRLIPIGLTATGNPAAAVAAHAGTAASRSAAGRLQLGRAEAILSELAKGAPGYVAPSMPADVSRGTIAALVSGQQMTPEQRTTLADIASRQPSILEQITGYRRY